MIHRLSLQAWRCAPENSGQVQLPSSPRGQCTLCKISVHLNQPHTVLHLNRTHVTTDKPLVMSGFFVLLAGMVLVRPLCVASQHKYKNLLRRTLLLPLAVMCSQGGGSLLTQAERSFFSLVKSLHSSQPHWEHPTCFNYLKTHIQTRHCPIQRK